MQELPTKEEMKNLKERINELPKPVKRLVVIGLLPIPGPVDEICLVLAAILMATVYRKKRIHLENFIVGVCLGIVLLECVVIGWGIHQLLIGA